MAYIKLRFAEETQKRINRNDRKPKEHLTYVI